MAKSTKFAGAVRSQLAEENPEAFLFADFDDALVGIARGFALSAVAVYDQDKCLRILMKRGLKRDEAEEYFDFNVIGTWAGEHMPIFLDKNIAV